MGLDFVLTDEGKNDAGKGDSVTLEFPRRGGVLPCFLFFLFF
jgi:hypothetical protein